MKQPSDPDGEYVGGHMLTPRDMPFADEGRAAPQLQRSASSEDIIAMGQRRSAHFLAAVAPVP
jgi:hypothetical protein